MASTAVEIVTREAKARVEAALPSLVEAIVPALLEAVLRGDKVEDVDTPLVPIPVDPKADAKDRAWRTLLQGLVATVLVGVTTALGSSLADPTFSFFELGSWTTALGAASAAAAMSGLAYIQRVLESRKAG